MEHHKEIPCIAILNKQTLVSLQNLRSGGQNRTCLGVITVGGGRRWGKGMGG
jgi:hypothetical protein